jgi:hypothetical protein
MVTLQAAATASFNTAVSAGETLDFRSATGTLDLAQPGNFAGVIDGFGGNDVIDLVNMAATATSFASNMLSVTDNSAAVANLHFAGTYQNTSFVLTSDQHGGTLIHFT